MPWGRSLKEMQPEAQFWRVAMMLKILGSPLGVERIFGPGDVLLTFGETVSPELLRSVGNRFMRAARTLFFSQHGPSGSSPNVVLILDAEHTSAVVSCNGSRLKFPLRAEGGSHQHGFYGMAREKEVGLAATRTRCAYAW